MEISPEEIELFQDIIQRGKHLVDVLESNGKEALQDMSFKDDFESWKVDSLRFMETHFDKSTTAFAMFSKPWFMGTQLRVPHYLKDAITVMESYCKIPKDKVMIPETTNNGGIHINVEQHQSQSQNQEQQIKLEFLIEAIKDELKGAQVKELKQVLEEDIPEEEKKTKFMDKIKSFGENTVSNILANIVTNPATWAALASLL